MSRKIVKLSYDFLIAEMKYALFTIYEMAKEESKYEPYTMIPSIESLARETLVRCRFKRERKLTRKK